jgi:hypothetical protein
MKLTLKKLCCYALIVLITGCATKYQPPAPDSAKNAQIRFVTDQFFLASVSRIKDGCTSEVKPVRVNDGSQELLVGSFGKNALFGLPFSPGAKIGMPNPSYPREVSAEYWIPGGVNTFLFEGIISDRVTSVVSNQINRKQIICNSVISLKSESGGVYQLNFEFKKINALGSDEDEKNFACNITGRKYSAQNSSWLLIAPNTDLIKTPTCLGAKKS